MITLLHTADWHLGQTLRGFSREHEHRRVFDRLVAIVEEHEIDALIVAGDVFDGQNPSGESLRLLYDLLVRLHRARPAMTIVIVAGNHDAAGRLEAPRELLRAIRVHVVGNVLRRDGRIEAERHLVPVTKGRGEIAAYVLAVSYPTAACLPALARSGEEGSPITRAVEALYAELFEGVRARLGGVPLIVTGHLHVAGAIESEGAERRILIGGQHAVPHGVFPPEAAYVALGHLHKAQAVGRDSVRYCGSLFPLSATEQPYRHGVAMAAIEHARMTSTQVPIERPVAFIRLPERGHMRLDEVGDGLAALGLDPGLPLDERPFVDVRLAREGAGAGFRAEVDRVAERFPVRIVEARLAAPPEPPALTGMAQPLCRLAERDPEEMFRLAFTRSFVGPPEPPHLEVFHRALAGA